MPFGNIHDMTNTRTCTHCEKPIIGRSDKKYCSVECRFDAYKLRKQLNMQSVQNANNILLKNREILKTLSASGNIVVERRTLQALGFDPSNFASMFINASGRTYYLCYDFAFSPTIEKDTQKAIVVARRKDLPKFDPWKR